MAWKEAYARAALAEMKERRDREVSKLLDRIAELRNQHAERDREVERLREAYKTAIYGHHIEHQSAGMFPQLAGWYACPVGDDKHKNCAGPSDTRGEAIEDARRRNEQVTALTPEPLNGEGKSSE